MDDYQETLSIYKNYSMEAEQAVIGAVLLENYHGPKACEELTPEDFYNYANRMIFTAIADCIENNQPCDVITLSTFLESTSQLEDAGGMGYLAELAHNTPSAANINAYIKVVREKRKERDVLLMASQTEQEIKADEGNSQDRVNNALAVVTTFDHEDEKEQSYGDMNKGYLGTLMERYESDGALTGYSTGFQDIDSRLNGLQNSDLIIVAARPAMGKTTYALNIAKHVAKSAHCVVFSMEMSGQQLIEKLYASDGVSMTNLKTGKLNDADWTMVQNAAAKASKLNLTIDERGALTPQQIRAKCLNIKRKHKEIGMVMIDYIQLMRVNKATSKVDEVTQISGALKALAKELNCPVVALSQLNRSVESRPDKRPVMSDLRDSGSIEQDADIIQFIYRDEYYCKLSGADCENPGVAEIITSKFRGGEVGKDFLKEQFKYSRFIDMIPGYVQNEPKPAEKKPYKKF